MNPLTLASTESSNMTRLIYGSRSTAPVDLATVAALLRSAVRNNAARKVTGLLCCSRQVFVQVLEGERKDVSETFARIARDNRHHHIELLSVRETDVRLFSDWSMGYAGLADATRAVLRPVLPNGELAYDHLSGDGALDVLLALRPFVAEQTAALHHAA